MTRWVPVKPAIVWHGSYAGDRSDVPEPWLHKAIAAAILFGDGFLIDSRILAGTSSACITRAMNEDSGFRRMIINRGYVQVMDVKPASPKDQPRAYRTIPWPAPYTPIKVQVKEGFYEIREGPLKPEQSFGVLPSGGPTPPAMVDRKDENDAAMFLEGLRDTPTDDGTHPANGDSRKLVEQVRKLMSTVVANLGEGQFEHLLLSKVCDRRGVQNESEDRRQGIMKSLAADFDSLVRSSAAIPNGHRQVTQKVCNFLKSVPARVHPIVDELTAEISADHRPPTIEIRTIDVLGFVACW